MKLSTKGTYGLRAVLDIAIHQRSGPVALNSIAKREDISEGYLEQLMALLKRAGIVRSVRGAQGGYLLTRNPKDLTVGEIIRVLEGPVAPVACVAGDNPEECHRAASCVTRLVWEKLAECISGVLDSFRLEDLVQEAAKRGEQENMYYI
ncbi:MAG: Rrf2 family transcriptional regulator [Peptococcaceae bacterium]|jgi:Rrf2 family protein|nr:Rrf2 family transcriptional regulator [Peptococcaceae bacterium]